MPLNDPPAVRAASSSHRWPITYQPSLKYRIGFGAFGAVGAVGLTMVAGYFILHPPRQSLGIVLTACLVPAAVGAYVVAQMVVSRFVLYENLLEVFAPFRKPRRIRRDEISGHRIIKLDGATEQLVLELRGFAQETFKMTLVPRRDAALDAWLAGIPDLEARDLATFKAELIQEVAKGRSEEDLRLCLAWARRSAWVLNAASLGAAAWGWLYPRPYPIAMGVMAAIPVLAFGLVVSGGGRFAVAGQRNDPRPQLLLPIFLPGAVLGLRAILDFNYIGASALYPWVLLATTGMALALRAADPAMRKAWRTPVLVGVIVILYPWGVLAQANVLLDHGGSEIHHAVVLEKASRGGKVTTYKVRLAPWGPLAAASSADVSRAAFDALGPGGTACIALQRGALGVPWFAVGPCT